MQFDHRLALKIVITTLNTTLNFTEYVQDSRESRLVEVWQGRFEKVD